ncbi:AAA family ATPase [Thermomicrobium sp.]|uniref:AAA family ATPase n=1 Tax=Thermomicrobium sp. TaxID=1969469 RepID=UPI001B13E129|nr:AAA family ATPase [Thermomicrobium sp.]MBO9307983.1 ATP-binding protein [Thermomicrobium sp.]
MTMRDGRSWISDVLHHQFVDREAELEQLVLAVAGPIPLGTLVLVGPPGVGKSALLREFARCCSELAIPCALVALTDEIGPDLVALRAAEHLGSAERTLQGLFAEPGRRVLLLDNYRAGSMLDEALRAALLAGSGETLVVMAMREAPPTSWFRDPGWSAVLRVLPLENLPHAAAVRFLTDAGVEQSAANRLAELTAGHPLSLLLLRSKQAPHSAPYPDVPLEISERVLDFAFGELASVQRTAFEITALAGVSS